MTVRLSDDRATSVKRWLEGALSKLAKALASDVLILVEDARYRIRRLPIRWGSSDAAWFGGDVEPRMSAYTCAENRFVEQQPAIALLDVPAIGIEAAFFGNVVLTTCHHLLLFSFRAFQAPQVR